MKKFKLTILLSIGIFLFSCDQQSPEAQRKLVGPEVMEEFLASGTNYFVDFRIYTPKEVQNLPGYKENFPREVPSIVKTHEIFNGYKFDNDWRIPHGEIQKFLETKKGHKYIFMPSQHLSVVMLKEYLLKIENPGMEEQEAIEYYVDKLLQYENDELELILSGMEKTGYSSSNARMSGKNKERLQKIEKISKHMINERYVGGHLSESVPAIEEAKRVQSRIAELK